jgi:hypothetical protein
VAQQIGILTKVGRRNGRDLWRHNSHCNCGDTSAECQDRNIMDGGAGCPPLILH